MSQRVAHVLHSLDVGGAEMLVSRIVRAGRARGWPEPRLLCLDHVGPLGERLRAEGFDVRCVERQPGLDWSVIGRLADELDDSVDVVHCHQYTPWFYGTLAAARARRPVAFTEHGRHQPDRPRLKRVLFNRWLLRHTGAISAVSRSIREALVANEKLPAGRIRVLYNGIDPAPFAPAPGRREAARAALGVDEGTFLVGHAGRLVPVKNQGLLLAAAARLRGLADRPVRLQVAGDGPLRKELGVAADSLGVGDITEFLGRRDDLPELLAAWDAFVLCSHSEGTSVTLLEAMAAGCPVVATAVGGNPELVEDGGAGYLVAAGDEAALAEALARLAADPGARARMGVVGQARVEANFSFDAMMDGMQQLWAEAMGT